ncbi:MAG: flavin-containing monooxygenase [Sporichthyaceae bacterium]
MTEIDVLIVGAGVSGIGAACRIARECPGTTYLVAEGRKKIGGTWDLFKFPGVRTDTDPFTYGYTFKAWTRSESTADGEDIRQYIEDAATEAGVQDHIRFDTKVLDADWSSSTGRWTVRVAPPSVSEGRLSSTAGVESEISCRFLYMCTGYYSYEAGYQPEFPGREDFAGTFVHPQFWPEDLDYTGKRVVVIGSGATAVTVVPAMAKTAGHVTMLQRSPTYMFALPGKDALAVVAQKVLPEKAAHKFVWGKNVLVMHAVYGLARKRPQTFKKIVRKMAMQYLKDPALVDEHFTPRYEPWDQRLCFVPDGDLYKAIRSGSASVVTDTIDSFVPEGIRLSSGKVLEADIVVSATGLNLVPMGGLSIGIDGAQVDMGETTAYRAVMVSGVPNFAFCFGYASNTWTLRADLSSQYVCRLLNHMRKAGHDVATPTLPAGQGRKPFLDLTSGYVTRGIGTFPAAGTSGAWVVRGNYFTDRKALKAADVVEDMTFGKVARVKDPATV